MQCYKYLLKKGTLEVEGILLLLFDGYSPSTEVLSLPDFFFCRVDVVKGELQNLLFFFFSFTPPVPSTPFATNFFMSAMVAAGAERASFLVISNHTFYKPHGLHIALCKAVET